MYNLCKYCIMFVLVSKLGNHRHTRVSYKTSILKPFIKRLYLLPVNYGLVRQFLKGLSIALQYDLSKLRLQYVT